MTNLEVNGVVISDLEYNIEVSVGGASPKLANEVNCNNNTVWKKRELPQEIIDFNATDIEVGQVTCTWTPVVMTPPVTSYNLWKDGILIVENIVTPHTYIVAAGYADYHVSAINSAGETASNVDEGRSILPIGGQQDFIANGVFTVPEFVTSITACIAGGGGSGGNGWTSSNAAGGSGGGGGSGSVTGTFAVTPFQEIAVTIGAGGVANPVNGGSGNVGGSSYFLTLVSYGGKGGTAWPTDPFGNGVGGAGGSGGGAGGYGSQSLGNSQAGFSFSGCGGSFSGGAGYPAHTCGDCGVGGGGGAGGFGSGSGGSSVATPGFSGGSGGSGENIGGPVAGGGGKCVVTW